MESWTVPRGTTRKVSWRKGGGGDGGGRVEKEREKKACRTEKSFFHFPTSARKSISKEKKLPALLLGLFSSFSFFWNISAMLLRNLQDRATGRRVSAGEGVSSAANEGTDATSPTTTTMTTTTTSPTTPARRSLAASADLAPRLRVVATCDGHDGCVNAVSFAGERAERLVTGESGEGKRGGGGGGRCFSREVVEVEGGRRKKREKKKKKTTN